METLEAENVLEPLKGTGFAFFQGLWVDCGSMGTVIKASIPFSTSLTGSMDNGVRA